MLYQCFTNALELPLSRIRCAFTMLLQCFCYAIPMLLSHISVAFELPSGLIRVAFGSALIAICLSDPGNKLHERFAHPLFFNLFL